MKPRENFYQKPKIKEKKVTLNMFYLKTPFSGDDSVFFASCWTSNCTPCGGGCGSDCAC